MLFLVLLVAARSVPGAECARITTWSNADSATFPVERTTRLDHNNTPGPYYFDLDNVQEKTLLVTYFAMNASPAKVSDQRFANAVSVSLVSFASQSDALAMYGREVANFNNINPYRWGFKLLSNVEGTAFAYYDDTPGQQQLNYLGARHNTITRITLKSASTTESLLSTGVSELGLRLVQARALVDQKCSINSEPWVWIEVSGRDSFATAFQYTMARGEIVIMASDGDGADDLDWGSFKVLVAGVDKTAHALQVVNRLAQQGRVKHEQVSQSTVRYTLSPHPSQLMDTHNLFNIAWNGEWPVELRLCDRRGACATHSYRLHFGPYLSVASFSDERCVGDGRTHHISLVLGWGNNGYAAASNFYVALGPADTAWPTWKSTLWSLSLLEPVSQLRLEWFDSSAGLIPVFTGSPVWLPTGTSASQVFDVPATANRRGGTVVPMPAGAMTLASAAIDMDQGTYHVDTQNALLCAPR